MSEAFVLRVRLCPSLGRVPIDMVAGAVAGDLPRLARRRRLTKADDAAIDRALVAIAQRNAIALSPVGASLT